MCPPVDTAIHKQPTTVTSEEDIAVFHLFRDCQQHQIVLANARNYGQAPVHLEETAGTVRLAEKRRMALDTGCTNSGCILNTSSKHR